jgi:hypothetical protein
MKFSLSPGPHFDGQKERMGKRALVDIDALVNRREIVQYAMHIPSRQVAPHSCELAKGKP